MLSRIARTRFYSPPAHARSVWWGGAQAAYGRRTEFKRRRSIGNGWGHFEFAPHPGLHCCAMFAQRQQFCSISFSAPAIGGKANASMSSRTVKYTAGEIGRLRVVEDFLPPPADLVPREDNVKVTLSLSRRSLDFFKREARKRRVPYQRMIRALVNTYAERQAGSRAK